MLVLRTHMSIYVSQQEIRNRGVPVLLGLRASRNGMATERWVLMLGLWLRSSRLLARGLDVSYQRPALKLIRLGKACGCTAETRKRRTAGTGCGRWAGGRTHAPTVRGAASPV